MLIRDGLIMDMIAIILKYINMIWTLNCAYIELFHVSVLFCCIRAKTG